jgi:HAMP domain-containing protein
MPTESSPYRRLSLRGKLYLNLGLLCVLIGCLALLANWCMAVMADMTERTLKETVRLADVADHVSEHTLQCRRYEKDIFLNLHDPKAFAEYKRSWREAFAELRKVIGEFRAHAVEPDDVKTAESWMLNSGKYEQAMLGILQQVEAGKLTTGQQANEALTPHKETIRELTASAVEAAHRKMADVVRVENDLAEIVSFFRSLILIVMAVALVVTCVFGYRLVQDLTQPIAALRDAARKIGEGDWYTRVDLRRTDELGELANAFNQMMAKVRERAQVTMQRQPLPRDSDASAPSDS